MKKLFLLFLVQVFVKIYLFNIVYNFLLQLWKSVEKFFLKYLFINISKFCRYKDKFSKFANDVLYRARHPIKIPLGASVFDYVLDESSGTFIRWSDKSQERMKILAGGFTITPEVRDDSNCIEGYCENDFSFEKLFLE